MAMGQNLWITIGVEEISIPESAIILGYHNHMEAS